MGSSGTKRREGSSGGKAAAEEEDKCVVRVFCRGKIAAFSREPGLYWLIGSPFFLPPFTVVSALRSLHRHDEQPYSPDFAREADDLRTLLLRGLDVVGALFVGDGICKENASRAVEASFRLRRLLFDDEGSYNMIGAATDSKSEYIQFFVSEAGKPKILEALTTVIYQDSPEKYLWEIGCLIRCELSFKLPVYVPMNKTTDVEDMLSSVTDDAASKFRDPRTLYLIERTCINSDEVLQPIILHGAELDFSKDMSNNDLPKDSVSGSNKKSLSCSYFCSKAKRSSSSAVESADTIRVSILSNSFGNPPISGAPVAEYFPTPEPARLFVVSFKLDVLCYASKDYPVASAVTKLIIPGLVNQLASIKKVISPKLVTQHPQLYPCHFSPPGVLHPITAIYELSYGEMEAQQVETRRSLHLRLGLPLDRPLLLIANALTFGTKDTTGSKPIKTGFPLLKDVHTELSSSGVSGGLSTLVQGSYEYHHYLQDGFDDSGWGCAYRSLQTIISWFRLQHYTSIEVPSHREIQQALVEIGDKEPSFVGSREWIGAIELSFVLDKLLGVSCKIINVRSGTELPEKCRELALHFEMQGTPVMIGGGVLAYTLLGVDYNDASGDCAFLILDPHYTGSDELKKIVNGGWCGWKKAVDSKGKNFFLSDKFYNLLLPQRPNMV